MQHQKPQDKANAGAGKVVAVTGASGFIGGRIVSLLRQTGGHDVVRAYGRRASNSGLNVLRLEELAAVDRALSGCHALVHCAFDFHDMAANLRMIRVLGPACAANGVRLILLSTAAVYEPFPDDVFDETALAEPTGVAYSDTKIGIEQELIQQSRTLGLDVVILQPTLVYGPHCRQWTDTPVRELLTGRVVLPQDGQGICNAVYVDDVCAAAIAAVNADIPSGERFIVSGPRPVTWVHFYSALRAALGTGTISCMPPAVFARRAQPSRHPNGSRWTIRLKRLATQMLGAETMAKLKFGLQRLRAGGGELVHAPHGAKLDLFSSRGVASTIKASRVLDWEPRVEFEEGMGRTTEYVRSAFAAQIARARRRDGKHDRLKPAAARPSGASAGRSS